MGKPTRVKAGPILPRRASGYWRTMAGALLVFLAGQTSQQLVAAPPASGDTKTNKSATFRVDRYAVEGNTALPPARIEETLRPFTGAAVDIDRVVKGVGELQLLYRHLGFATVAVSVPQQRVTNGVVRLVVIEGRLSEINVKGNRHFSSNNVMRLFPGLTTNVILNTKWFQPELDRANANSDRQIYPVIGPGQAPGETTLTLNVKDRVPIHGHIEANNISTPNTPALRIDTALQDNNLWQLDHQAGLEYNFSPQAFKDVSHEPRFYDLPAVASYSGFYRIPFPSGENLRDTYERLPVDFGYDPVSHIFHLPAPTGSPEVNFYASRSDTETPTLLGPRSVISSSALLELSSQSAQQTVIVSEGVGSRIALPLRELGGLKSTISAGFDLKNFQERSYSTNISYIQTYATNNAGSPTLTGSTNVPIAANSRADLTYLPLAAEWDASLEDRLGATMFHAGDYLFLSPLATDRNVFRSVAETSGAGGNYTVFNASVGRDQKLGGGWGLSARASGQWSSAPLISNEQFALGGAAGTRGYENGESYGDDGWRLMGDLRAPSLRAGSFPTGSGRVPGYVRFGVFMDYGGAEGIDHAVARSSVTQWGTGLDLRLTAGERLEARLTLGWALLDTPLSHAGEARASFKVGIQF